MVVGPHAHDVSLDAPEGVAGPWGWPCPVCATENVVRELPAAGGEPVEVRCDYCGAISEFSF